MPAKAERVRFEIKEVVSGDARTFNIILTVPARDFLLTDLLKQKGVIDPLDTELKQAVKGATEKYLRAAETLVSGLAVKPRVGLKSRTHENGNAKSEERSPEF